jgi:hypothetical protein
MMVFQVDLPDHAHKFVHSPLKPDQAIIWHIRFENASLQPALQKRYASLPQS